MTVSVMAPYVDRQPYVGVRPFRAHESGQFFGRAEAVTTLAGRWRRRGLSVLTGPPGSGKSSLLHAKLVPEAAARGARVLPVGRPFAPPPPTLAALPDHNPYTLALLCSWAPGTPPGHLAGLSLYEFLRAEGFGRPDPLFVAIDQVEKVFERHARLDAHRDGFLAQLREAVTELPGLHLLLSVREERLPELEAALGPLDPYRLDLLTRADALEAVERPVLGSGRWYTDGAAEEIVSAVAADSEAVDPVLLQVVCSRLWASLPGDATAITAEDVHARPGVEPSLREFCGRAIADVAAGHGVPALRLASWLQRTFVAGTATAESAAGEGLPAAVLPALQDRYVLGFDGSYRLHHDRLADPLMRLDVPDLRQGDTGPWERLSAAESALFRGDLEVAEHLLAPAVAEVGEEDLTFLARTRSRLGDLAYLRGDPQGAVTCYRAAAALAEALQDNAAVAGLLAAIGHAHLAQGLDVEAVETMRSAVDRLPGDLSLQTGLGRMLWRVGQGSAGVTVLTEVLNTGPHTLEALRARGEMLADLGQAERALGDLDQVGRQLRPEGRAARALALAGRGRPGDAEADLTAALGAGPENGPALFYAARVRALSGDHAGAADLAHLSLAATAPALTRHQRAAAVQLLDSASS